ncbi:hypothetical protein [Sphingomonas sp.]|uniref:hypothetical protein n=1 Tax=Sphingomonas sp. TaxID=28214 RepID=UPI0031D81A55
MPNDEHLVFDWEAAKTLPPQMPYLSLFTDDQGRSRLGMCTMDGFVPSVIGGKTDALWQRSLPTDVVGVKYLVMPVGWQGAWHESPAPQWVIPLSGRWFLESAAGERIEMGPGDLHWGQDLNTTDGRGHRSGQIGEEPCVLLMLQFASPQGSGACPL